MDFCRLGTPAKPYDFNRAGDFVKGGQILEARYDENGQMIYAKTAKAQVYLGYTPSGKRVYRQTIRNGQPTVVKESFYPMSAVIVENGAKQSFVNAASIRLGRLDHDKKEWFYYIRDHLGSSEIML